MKSNERKANHTSQSRASSAKLTLKVEGPYFPIDKFQKVLQNFSRILSEIDKDISRSRKVGVEWFISEVQQGGIVITAEANIVDDLVEIERPREIIKNFCEGLELIRDHPQLPLHFTNIALENVKKISDLIDPNDFAEIKFFAENWQFNMTRKISANIEEITKNFYQIHGSIEGQLVSISNADQQNIGIRSLTSEKIVKCFFSTELFERARESLGKRVYVLGLIRQSLHGEKIHIHVEELKVFPEKSSLAFLSNIIDLLRG
jgi:hypothetical protein